MNTSRMQAWRDAQDFLTVNHPQRVWRIRVEELLERHEPEEVIDYLDRLYRSHKKKLERLIRLDKSDPRVDESLALVFRLKMAMRIIRKAMAHREAA